LDWTADCSQSGSIAPALLLSSNHFAGAGSSGFRRQHQAQLLVFSADANGNWLRHGNSPLQIHERLGIRDRDVIEGYDHVTDAKPGLLRRTIRVDPLDHDS
jgi:hypothetical protein